MKIRTILSLVIGTLIFSFESCVQQKADMTRKQQDSINRVDSLQKIDDKAIKNAEDINRQAEEKAQNAQRVEDEASKAADESKKALKTEKRAQKARKNADEQNQKAQDAREKSNKNEQ